MLRNSCVRIAHYCWTQHKVLALFVLIGISTAGFVVLNHQLPLKKQSQKFSQYEEFRRCVPKALWHDLSVLSVVVSSSQGVIALERDFFSLFKKNCVPHLNETIEKKWLFATEYLPQKNQMNFTAVQLVTVTRPSNADYLVFETSPKRAILKSVFKTIAIDIFDSISIRIPKNLNEFFLHWQNSEMFQCRKNLKTPIYEEVYGGNSTIPHSFIRFMASFRDAMLDYSAFPMLEGGTLLGWRRQCGFIPDTLDVDFSLPANEYNTTMLESLRNRGLKIHRLLGRLNDSFEFSVMANNTIIDLFLRYRIDNYTYLPGIDVYTRQKWRFIYPLVNQTCAGDLYGHLMFLPCNVDEQLEAVYGKNWTIPHRHIKYHWSKSAKNARSEGYWTAEEMKSVYILCEKKTTPVA